MSNDSEHKEGLEDQAASLRNLVEETLVHKAETQNQHTDKQIVGDEESENRKQIDEWKQSMESAQKSEVQDFSHKILNKIEEDDRKEKYFSESEEDIVLTMDDLTEAVEQLCISKAEEFALLGYDNVTGEEVWKCVSSKYKKGYPALHVIVNDILSLKADKFMNWLLIQSYKS
jgi:hypothetical protein